MTWMIVADLQMEHSMHLRVLHLRSDLSTDDIALLLRVAQLTREKRIRESFESFRDLQVVPGANLLLFPRLW